LIVKEQKPFYFVNKCSAIYNTQVLDEALKWHNALKSVAARKTIYLHARYPCVTSRSKKIHAHRLVVSWLLKRKLMRNEYVHHINGNKLDFRLENLELIQPSKHQSLTNKGRKQTKEHIMKRINAVSMTRYGHMVYENPEREE